MSFAACLDVERHAKRLLLPFVKTEFGAVPKEIAHDYASQATGDWTICDRMGYTFTVELKAEVVDTGNLFLETVSNVHTMRYGWLCTSRAEQLWYLFVDTRTLYTMRFCDLRWWAWGDPEDVESGAIGKYRCVRQKKHKQENLTEGFIVPFSALASGVRGFRILRV